MIQERIKISFAHHLSHCRTEQQSLFIVDYTQKTPFLNFTFPPAYLRKMKKRHNVIIHLQNAITIRNEKQINVKS